MNVKVYYSMALGRRFLSLIFLFLVLVQPTFAVVPKEHFFTVDSGRIFLSIPQNETGYELRITAQVDSGMGMIHYGLPVEGPYILKPLVDTGIIGLVDIKKTTVRSFLSDIWQTPAMINRNNLELPLTGWEAEFEEGRAQLELTSRLLTGDGLYQIVHPDLDHEEVDLARVMSIDTCFGGCLVRLCRYFYHTPKANTDESLKMSGLLPVSVSVFLTCVPSEVRSANQNTVWFVSPRLPKSVRSVLDGIFEQDTKEDNLCSSVCEGHATAATCHAIAYDVTARDVSLQKFPDERFVRLLIPGAMASKDVVGLLIRKGYGMRSLPDCRMAYHVASDSLLRQRLLSVLEEDKQDFPDGNVLSDELLLFKADSLTELYFKRAEELLQAVRNASVVGSSVIPISIIGDALHSVWLNDVVQPLCKALMSVSDKKQARYLSDGFVRLQCRLAAFYSAEGAVLCGREGLMSKNRASWDLLWCADFWQKRYEHIISTHVTVARDVVLEGISYSLRRYCALSGSVVRRSCFESAKAFIDNKKEEQNSVSLSDTYAILLQGWFAQYQEH